MGVDVGEAGGETAAEADDGGGDVDGEEELEVAEADRSEGRAGERVGEAGVRQITSSSSSTIGSAAGAAEGSRSMPGSLPGSCAPSAVPTVLSSACFSSCVHSITLQSSLAEASSLPSGEKRTTLTGSVCLLMFDRKRTRGQPLPSLSSSSSRHSRMLWSAPAVAKRPLGETDRDRMGLNSS